MGHHYLLLTKVAEFFKKGKLSSVGISMAHQYSHMLLIENNLEQQFLGTRNSTRILVV